MTMWFRLFLGKEEQPDFYIAGFLLLTDEMKRKANAKYIKIYISSKIKRRNIVYFVLAFVFMLGKVELKKQSIINIM